MRRTIRQLVPSMFHRRLWLLMLTAIAICACLAIQMARLTVIQGSTFREEAEGALMDSAWIPTARGRILDRKMRVLAQDRSSYDVKVQYPVISGEWAYEAAKLAARRASATPWSEKDFDEQEDDIARLQPVYDREVDSLLTTLCILGKVNRAELEQRMADIKSRVQEISGSQSLRRWTRQNERARADKQEPIELWEATQNIAEQHANYALLTGVNAETALKVQRLIAVAEHAQSTEVWGQVSVEPSRERDYPAETMALTIDRSSLPTPLRGDPVQMNIEGVAMHLIGLMRPVWKEDIKSASAARIGPDGRPAIDLRGYQLGDTVGWWGVEHQLEDTLRGSRGQAIHHLDSDTYEHIAPVPGGDAVLTIDAQLQARVEAIMDPSIGLLRVQWWQSHDPTANPDKPNKPKLGEPLNGAAVVMDVATGEVLAAVSEPAMTLREMRDEPATVWRDQMNMPYLNRAVSQAYQPGSTVKPLVLAAAVTDRKLGYDETIDCTGHFYPNDTNHFRCWIYKMGMTMGTGAHGHGPLTGPHAIEQSCNMFFMTMGQRLGLDRLTWWYQRYGLSQPTGCGLSEEVRGTLPVAGGGAYTPEDALFLGMGQGPILWTPLQAATAYTTLARGGQPIVPTFIKAPEQGGREGVDLHLDPKGVEMSLEGMYLAANSPQLGTSSHLSVLHEPVFNLPGVKIMAKSGTADAAPLRIDSDHDGRITSKDEIVREGDHAWSVVLVQRPGSTRPDYVVIVIVEFGGSGGNVAAPVSNQILHAMRQEGYL